MEIADIQRTARIGAVIEVILANGKEVVGKLTQLSEQAIAIQSNSHEMIISISAIALVSCSKSPSDLPSTSVSVKSTQEMPELGADVPSEFSNAMNLGPAQTKLNETSPSTLLTSNNSISSPLLRTVGSNTENMRSEPSMAVQSASSNATGMESALGLKLTEASYDVLPASLDSDSSSSLSEIDHNTAREEHLSDKRHLELLSRVMTTEAEFRTALAITRLDPIDYIENLPEVQLRSLNFERRRQLLSDWDSCSQKYRYALKIKDLSRLNQIIHSLRMILQEHPSLWCVHFNIGSLFMLLDKNMDAAQWFMDAARLDNASMAYYNASIAFLRHGDALAAEDALVEFFRCHPISTSLSAWHTLIKLGIAANSTAYLRDMFETAVRNENSDNIRVIVRTLEFLLQRAGMRDGALSLEEALESNSGTLQSTIRFWFDRILQPGQPRLSLAVRIDSPTILVRPRQIIPSASTNIKQREQDGRDFAGSVSHSANKSEFNLSRKQVARSPKSILERADAFARAEQYDSALLSVRELLQIDPENRLAQQREQEYLAKIRIRTLPAGVGPYRKAKEAETLEKNLSKAEALYREAIAVDDRLESAVKDLALILAGQNRIDEAISLLLKYRSRIKAQLPYMQTLVTIYQKREDYQKIIPLLHSIHGLVPANRQVEILKRIALAYTKLGEYDRAETTLMEALRHSPEDASAKALLETLRQARQTGTYNALQSPLPPIELYFESRSRLSDFLNYFLEKCDYEGVRASTRASGEFTEEDVKFLEDKARPLGTQRPEERAAFYLSAAKILIVKLSVPGDDRHPRIYLRNFAAAMGDVAVLQKKLDVARTFYAEAFTVAPEWAEQLNVKLSQFIMLSYASPADVLSQSLPLIEVSLQGAFKHEQLRQQIIEDLLSLSLLNADLPQILRDRVNRSPALIAEVMNVCRKITGVTDDNRISSDEWGAVWGKGLDLMRQRQQAITDGLRFVDSQAESLDALQEQITQLQELQPKLQWLMDKKRLNSVSDIVGLIRNYTQQHRYLEQEMLANTIKNRIRELVEQIELSPTKLSLEYFRPYLTKIGKTVEDHFARVRMAAEPDQLEATLVIEFSTPNEISNEIECHIQIRNADGKSPASAVVLEVLDADADEYTFRQRMFKVAEALNGDERVTCIVPLTVSRTAIQAQVFVLNLRLRYTTRGGRTVETGKITLPIGLFGDTDFVPIDPNPYTWAQGGAVQDKQMFFGRDALIERIITTIQNASSNKSLVIYGQKRAGKSSILYHLGRRLVESNSSVIPVSFSVAEILNISLLTFLYKIIQEMDRAMRSFFQADPPPLPNLIEFEKFPDLLFHEYMNHLNDFVKCVQGDHNIRIMLLLDEFADLYSAIRKGTVPDTFMKSWKAMLEKQYFGSVLVGSLVMRNFIDQFPNEFQVAEPIRVSYLDPPDARALIEDPIRLPDGTSRYRGPAVERLLDLTAGSPFYIQIFCNRLVNYINDKKRPISDADIELVKDDLLTGNNCLDKASFDNLLSAGDRPVDPIPRDDVERVLRAIAAGTKTQSRFDPTVTLSQMDVKPILDALVTWDVIERRGAQYRIRVSLFKEWLLATQ